MTDRRVSQTIAEIAELATTNQRRVSQTIAEVAEIPTTNQRRTSQTLAEVAEIPTINQRRVSQVILEVSYKPGAFSLVDIFISNTVTKTYSIDSFLKKTSTKTSSIDALLSGHIFSLVDVFIVNKRTKTMSVNSLIKKTVTLGGDFDGGFDSGFNHGLRVDALLRSQRQPSSSLNSLLLKRQTKTLSVDASLVLRKTVSTSFDVFIFNKPTISTIFDAYIVNRGKYSLVDALIKAGSTVKSYNMDAFVAPRARSFKTYTLDTLLHDTNNPVDSGTLDDALTQPTIKPAIRLSRVISRNSTLDNAPSITISDVGENISNLPESMIDGYNRSSMKFAFADSDATTNDGYRWFPDTNKWETDEEIENQKVPWVSSELSGSTGTLSATTFTIHYTNTNVFNMVEFVTDKWGKGQAGIVTNLDIEASNNGSAWTTIGSGESGFSCPEPHRFQMFYFYNQDSSAFEWSTDKELFLANADGYPLQTVTYAYVRFIVHSISVDTASSTRPRHLLAYESGAYLWDAGIQDVNVTNFSIQEDRDLSSQTLSPIGSSNANTFNLTGTAAGKDTPYYFELVDPLGINHDQFQGAMYIATIGIKLADDSYTYLPYGTFLADTMTLSAPDGNVSISGRDYSKILQETKMPSMFYQDIYLHEVIHDIVERAGIEKFNIDTTEYTLTDLAPAVVDVWLSDDALVGVHEPNIVWTNEQSCWEFLQSIAYADLGVFYFDRDNTFIYKSKEDLTRSDYTADFNLTEDDSILSFNTSNEIMKNTYKVTYKVPRVTPNPVSLWDDNDEEVLDTTALSENITADETSITVGDISAWTYEGFFQIDNEIIKYKDRDDNTFKECERGWLGTKATSHPMNNSLSNWNFSGGTWDAGGGKLTASTSDWETALKDVNSSKYNLHVTVTINSSPYHAGIAVRAQGPNNYYRFVLKSRAVAGSPGATSDTDDRYYLLQEVVNGNANILKSVPWGKQNTDFPTGHAVRVRAQVDGRHLSFFVEGTRVLSYDIKDDDLQVGLPAKAGFVANGNNTTFEKVYIATLPEDRRGEEIIFRDSFGKPVYEVRRYEIEYQPGRWVPKNGESSRGAGPTTPPASGVEYAISNSDSFSVPYWQAGPFKAIIYVKNDTNSLAILNGTGGLEDVIPDYFYLVGYALYRQDQKTVDDKNVTLIQRYGRQEFNADLPFVQSDKHAKLLLNHIKAVFGKPVLFLDLDIHPRVDIALGDIVALSSTGNQFWMPTASPPKFYVTGVKIEMTEGGLKHGITLRSIVE